MKIINKSKIENLIILVACIGMFLSTLDTGIMNIALPFLTHHFETTNSIATISISGYTMTLAAVIMFFGVLSDKIGKLKVSLYGFIIFGLSSLLAGFSVNIDMLIFFRIFQGIGAAGLQTTSIAMITTFVNKERLHTAIGILGIAIGLGPVLGPTIGGLFLSLGDWRWIFWMNVPIVLISLLTTIFLFKNVKEHLIVQHKIDRIGMMLSAVIIICLLSGLSFVQSNVALAGLLILTAIIFTWILFKIEHHQTNPLFSLKLYKKSQHLGLFLLETMIFGFASALIFLFPPYLLEKHLGVSAGLAGLFVLGTPVGLVIFSRISSKLNKGNKGRKFVSIGFIMMTLSFILLFACHTLLTPFLVTIFLFIYGIGGGLFQPANIALISKSVPITIQGEIGSLQRMVQNIGISTGVTIGGVILSLHDSLLQNIKIGWLLGAIVLVVIIIIDCFSSDHN